MAKKGFIYNNKKIFKDFISISKFNQIIYELIKKDFCILDQNLTYYRQSQEMISSNFKFLSFSWWRRRKQAHDYVQYFFDKNRINHTKNLDYLLTNFIYFFIK